MQAARARLSFSTSAPKIRFFHALFESAQGSTIPCGAITTGRPCFRPQLLAILGGPCEEAVEMQHVGLELLDPRGEPGANPSARGPTARPRIDGTPEDVSGGAPGSATPAMVASAPARRCSLASAATTGGMPPPALESSQVRCAILMSAVVRTSSRPGPSRRGSGVPPTPWPRRGALRAASAAAERLLPNRSGDQVAIISRPAAPILAASSSSRDSSPMSRASPCGSRGSKVKPFTPSRTRSGAHPQRLDTRTGSPAAMASFTTSPQGSKALGRMKALAPE